jgi:hypothetical protein
MGDVRGGNEVSAPIAIRAQAADEAREVLLAISDKYGHITPGLVLDAARSEDSPLHDYFRWDDKEAGELFRLTQARFLIRTVKLEIVRSGGKGKEIAFETTRAYVSPPICRGSESYVPLALAMDDEDLRADLLARAKIELDGFRKRYKNLTELAQVWDAIDKI